MGVAILELLGGLILLLIGAEGLVRGASALALRVGLSPLLVGLTVVAFGTSAPELVVSLRAALAGQADVAVGNVVGSNIFNVGAILGLSALVFPIQCAAQIVRREVPLMIGAGLVLLVLVTTGDTVGRWEGVGCLALAALYVWGAYLGGRKAPPAVQEEFAGDVAGQSAAALTREKPWLNALLILAGIGLLAGGAELMVGGAVALARLAGISPLVIGLTVVGAGTGMPELATSLVAAFRKEPDISMGNVVGSCVFNILGILGATAAVRPLAVDPAVVHRDVPVMLVLFVLCLPVTFTFGKITRAEGALLLGIYLSYLAWLVVGSGIG